MCFLFDVKPRDADDMRIVPPLFLQRFKTIWLLETELQPKKFPIEFDLWLKIVSEIPPHMSQQFRHLLRIHQKGISLKGAWSTQLRLLANATTLKRRTFHWYVSTFQNQAAFR